MQVFSEEMEHGETHVPLMDFVNAMPPILRTSTPPGHTGRRSTRSYLSPQSQRLIFRLIELLFRELSVKCFSQLTEAHMTISVPSERPNFSSDIQQSPNRSIARMNSNVNSMGIIIRDMIMHQLVPGVGAGTLAVLPRGVRHLINLMLLPNPLPMRVPIQYHSSLVLIQYRGLLYCVQFQFLMDVLRYADREGFCYVLRGIEAMGDWSVNVQNSNTHLKKFYQKGRYDPYGCKYESVAKLEPLAYNRNVPSHTLEGSVSRRGLNGMRFNRPSINLALYFEFEMLLANLSVGLHRLGHLEHLGLSGFFPY